MSRIFNEKTAAQIRDVLSAGDNAISRSAYCERCNKAVAHLVAFAGQTWLYSPGGRVGSAATLVSELEATRDEADPDTQAGRAIFDAFDRFAQQAREENALNIAPASAERVTVDYFRPGEREVTVACRGCREWVMFTISPDLDMTPARRVPR